MLKNPEHSAASMTIQPTIDYLDVFFGSHIKSYRDMMRDVGGSRYPEPYKDRGIVIQSIRNVVHGIENLFADMSVPGGFASPKLLLEALLGFQQMMANQAANVAKLNASMGSPWLDEIEYAHRMSYEVSEAIEHALTLSADIAVPQAPLQRLLRLLAKFTMVARQLQERRADKGVKRPTLTVVDEYDVQDLLHAVLLIDFDDVRPEEWAPSYAGASKRSDFLLHREEIMIEVKKTRPNLPQPVIAEQLTIDIANYKQHPRAKHLVCVVWDAEHLLNNAAALKSDLEGSNDGFVTVAVLR